MIYAKANPDAIEALARELHATRDANWYRRLKIIQLSLQGRSVPDLATLFALSRPTVRDYLHRYTRGGVAGLARQYGPGRPVKVPLTKAEWEELLHRSPCQFEQLQTAARTWTQALLVDYVAVYHGIRIAQSTLATVFKRLGIRWNRGKLKVTSPDPLYTVKRERIETLKKKPSAAS